MERYAFHCRFPQGSLGLLERVRDNDKKVKEPRNIFCGQLCLRIRPPKPAGRWAQLRDLYMAQPRVWHLVRGFKLLQTDSMFFEARKPWLSLLKREKRRNQDAGRFSFITPDYFCNLL